MKLLLKILIAIALLIFIDKTILMLSPLMLFTVLVMAFPFYIGYKSFRFIQSKKIAF